MAHPRDSSDDIHTTALPDYLSRNLPKDKALAVVPERTPNSEASASTLTSPRPPPFSSLYFPSETELDHYTTAVTEAVILPSLATAPAPSFEEALAEDEAERQAAVQKKASLAKDSKGESSGKGLDDGEPPPPYTEGSSPLDSFTYVMAAAGGAASIITQVQQTGGPPINTLGAGEFCSGVRLDEG